MNIPTYPYTKRTFTSLVFIFLFIQINLVASERYLATLFSNCTNSMCQQSMQNLLARRNELTQKDEKIESLKKKIKKIKASEELLINHCYEGLRIIKQNSQTILSLEKESDILRAENQKNLSKLSLRRSYQRLLLLITFASLALSTYLWQTQ